MRFYGGTFNYWLAEAATYQLEACLWAMNELTAAETLIAANNSLLPHSEEDSRKDYLESLRSLTGQKKRRLTKHQFAAIAAGTGFVIEGL